MPDRDIFLGLFNNISSKINELSGKIVIIEIKIRLIAEKSPNVQNFLFPKKYSECNLFLLENAFEEIFTNELSEIEKMNFKKFRKLRNKFLHGNLVKFQELLDISPESRLIEKNNKRAILKQNEIIESIKTFERNQVFEKAYPYFSATEALIDKIIKIVW